MVASFLASAGVVALGVGIVTLIAIAVLIVALDYGWRFAWAILGYLSGKKKHSARSFERRSAVSSLD